MEEIVKYQDWPQTVKVTTAFYLRRLNLTTPTIPYVLGYLCFFMGIIGLAFKVFNSESFSLYSVLYDVGYLIIGLANIVSGNSIKWIANNSNWEERVQNKPSTKHQIIYWSTSLLLLACLIGIIFYWDL